MSPQKFCRNCGRVLGAAEQFCSACGTKVEGETSRSGGTNADSEARACSLCGHQNPAQARVCESCGAVLPALSGKKKAPARKSVSSHSSAGTARSKYLPGWKSLAALAVILVVVIVYLKSRSPEPTNTVVPQDRSQMVGRQIDSLRDVVQRNPQDVQALVHLANAYYDARLFPEAIETYTQYLQLQPSDADARVDLGVSYFNLSFVDSLHHAEDLRLAQDQMEKAISYQPKHQLAYFNLGIVTLHSGDVTKANEWFQKCIAIDSTSEAGRTARQFLSQHLNINRPTS